MSEDSAGEKIEQVPEIVRPQLPGWTRRGKRIGRPKNSSRESKKLKAVELAATGLNAAEIGRMVNLPDQTVRRTLKKFNKVFKHLPNVQAFRDTKSDILTAGQMQALESAFSNDKLKRATFLDTVKGFDILNKADRIENDKSTSNVSVFIKTSIE